MSTARCLSRRKRPRKTLLKTGPDTWRAFIYVDFFLTICDWQQKVGKEVDCEMPVEEEKAEKDTVDDRARRLERSAAEGPSDEGGGVGVGLERRFCDTCDVRGDEAGQGLRGQAMGLLY
jgi:hypothetical protein